MSGQIDYFKDAVNHYLRGLLEEAGEVSKACRKGDVENIKEEIGDTTFMLALIAQYYGIDLEEALHESAEKIASKERIVR